MPVDMVNSPPHYTQGKYETIEIIEDTNWGYRLATAFKYLHRCEYKGKKKEDLQKAIWFILREIKSIEDAPSNVGQDLGYNAWTCKECKQGTNLVNSDWVCERCLYPVEGNIDPDIYADEPTRTSIGFDDIPSNPHIVSKGSESRSKASEYAAKVIPHNLPKDPLGAVTEGRNYWRNRSEQHYPDYRALMSEKHYPDNQVHKEQLTLWEMVGYD